MWSVASQVIQLRETEFKSWQNSEHSILPTVWFYHWHVYVGNIQKVI